MKYSKHSTHLMSHIKSPAVNQAAQLAALETEAASDQTLKGSCSHDIYLFEFARTCNIMKYSKHSTHLMSHIKSPTVNQAAQAAALDIEDTSDQTLERSCSHDIYPCEFRSITLVIL